MRRQLAWLITAIMTMVLVVFAVPLGLLAQRLVADRAIGTATTRAESLIAIIALGNETALNRTVQQLNVTGRQPITVYLPNGTVSGPAQVATPGVRLAASGRSLTVAEPDGREILIAVAGLPSGTAVIRTKVSSDDLRAGLSRIWLILGALALALLMLGVLVADRLVRTVIRPIGTLAQVSQVLAGGDLGVRASVAGPAEVREVGAALNQLAAQIQALIRQEVESVADLSHRLRTPLTALRLEVDTMAATMPHVPTARLSAQIDALQRAVTTLIGDARYRSENTPRQCDAATVVAERAAFWSPLAEDQDRAMTTRLPSSPLPIALSAADLAACVDALIGNVFAHTPDGTSFAVLLTPADSGAVLEVIDAGPGFQDAERLRRGVSGSGSSGLGLDIARKSAESSGGTIRLRADRAGVVLVFGGPKS